MVLTTAADYLPYRLNTQEAPQVWPHGTMNRRKISDCVPAFHAVCPVFSDPVCGEDGRTYQNECVLAAHCVRAIHHGDCIKGEKIDLMARVLHAPGTMFERCCCRKSSRQHLSFGTLPVSATDCTSSALPITGRFKTSDQVETQNLGWRQSEGR